MTPRTIGKRAASYEICLLFTYSICCWEVYRFFKGRWNSGYGITTGRTSCCDRSFWGELSRDVLHGGNLPEPAHGILLIFLLSRWRPCFTFGDALEELWGNFSENGVFWGDFYVGVGQIFHVRNSPWEKYHQEKFSLGILSVGETFHWGEGDFWEILFVLGNTFAHDFKKDQKHSKNKLFFKGKCANERFSGEIISKKFLGGNWQWGRNCRGRGYF